MVSSSAEALLGSEAGDGSALDDSPPGVALRMVSSSAEALPRSEAGEHQESDALREEMGALHHSSTAGGRASGWAHAPWMRPRWAAARLTFFVPRRMREVTTYDVLLCRVLGFVENRCDQAFRARPDG
jgi:hypothetical protein